MENTVNQVINALQRICSKQEKCRADITDYLVRKGIPAEFHEQVLSQLTAGRFIDEERYAQAVVRDKLMLNRWGKMKIRHFLETKQISEERIERALGIIDESDYRKMIREEMHKKLAVMQDEDPGSGNLKMIRFAESRGYEEELVQEIFKFNGLEDNS
jgi:regulatory protein